MRITGVQALVCDAGWRPWIFCRVRTDQGITVYGECTDNHNPRAVLGAIDDLRDLVIGRDPCHTEMIYWDLYRATRHSLGYRPYFEPHSTDIAMLHVPWNGFTAAKKIADLAEAYEVSVCPHNYYNHLSTLISGHLCVRVPNVRIMETEVEGVPWKDDIVTSVPVIDEGDLLIPSSAGWRTDLDEAEVARRPWKAW